jgi:hypothetical protein
MNVNRAELPHVKLGYDLNSLPRESSEVLSCRLTQNGNAFAKLLST